MVPWRCALIPLHLDVPHLGDVLKIVRGHPHLLLYNVLPMEVRPTLIDEWKRIAFAIVLGKIHLWKHGCRSVWRSLEWVQLPKDVNEKYRGCCCSKRWIASSLVLTDV
jgi:hypothetical protein